jgi:hypothetical protein
MFDKFDEASRDILSGARHESMRSRSQDVSTEHLLLAITRDTDSAAAKALYLMNVHAENVHKELEKAAQAEAAELASVSYETIGFGETTRRLFERANDYRRFFGKERIAPEHVLLGILDSNDEGALRILEELGVNLTFLRRLVFNFIARHDCLLQCAPTPRPTVVVGVSEVIADYLANVESLQRLSTIASVPAFKLPDRSEVALLVFISYLPEFLLTQVAYQRYLLEETLKLVQSRTGPLDQESIAAVVAAAAQHMRSEVRAIVEQLWTQEYRVLNQMPDEAEHEEIGSIIEDLWWTYSEEIALHEVFDEAMDDYRRKHVLNLQKRKLEISQRLGRLRDRLEQTIKQCFLKRSLSA